MIDETERDRLLYGDAAIMEMKQFEKLRQLEPPLSSREIAHRMAWSQKQTRSMLNKVGDKRK